MLDGGAFLFFFQATGVGRLRDVGFATFALDDEGSAEKFGKAIDGVLPV